MTLHVRDAATWKQVTALSVRDGGTWKAVQAGYVRDAGSWKQFYGAGGGGGGGGGYSVSFDQDPASGFRVMMNFNTYGYVSTNINAIPSGFTSPTYAWTRVSGASVGGAFAASGINTSGITLGATIPVFTDCIETWRCTVTEGANSAYKDVEVTLRIENLS